jgi:hypothetical protein
MPALDVEAEFHDVAVGDHEFLAVHPHEALFLGRALGAGGDQVLVGDRFSLDKAALEVGSRKENSLRPTLSG